MTTHLLIDARNALYRAVNAVRADQTHGVKHHFFVAFLRQIASWINEVRPTSIHVFWDAPRATVWRKKVLPTYKNRDSSFVEGLAEDLALTTTVSKVFFDVMNVRQYDMPHMEADDLIYAAVSMLHPAKSVIVSTDSDMTQIPFRFNSCSVYHPKNRVYVEIPPFNPAHSKSLRGDVADSVDGYYGVGPKTSDVLLGDKDKLAEFFKVKGSKTFYRNLLLIDLAMCPRLLANTIHIQKQLLKPVIFDKSAINRFTMQYKVNGIQQDFANLVVPFQKLV